MRRALPLLFLLACTARTPARDARGDGATSDDVVPLTSDTSPIGLRRSLIADEYFWLRAKALEGDAPPAFKEALAAMSELRTDLAQDPTAWEDLEVPLGSVQRPNELSQLYGNLPRTRDVGGKPVPFRARALRLANAIGESQGAFRKGPFREHEVEITRAAKELGTLLVPKLEPVIHAVEAELDLPSGGTRPIVITLVGEAPYQGIFAADARGKLTASFVRVHGLAGSDLCEVVLHEALHAIDELTVRSPSAMNRLRAALARRGLDENDSNVEMAINTVTFAEAASLVRRFVDPAHRPLGESGFYELYPPAKAIVGAWEAHLTGAPIEATADAIATAVAAPRPPGTGEASAW